jgi:carbamoyltransferase
MEKPTYILGISCYYHDSGIVLLKDGEVIFAAQEERYTRRKHDDALPINAIAGALEHESITIDDIDVIGFYEKPLLKFFDRILTTYFKVWPKGFFQYHRAMQGWMTKKLWIPNNIRTELKYKGEILFIPHHESHAASSYLCSGFSDSAIVTVDGVGEWATTTIGHGQGNDFKLLKEIHFPHSLGLLYSAVTYYLGFKVNSAEYKVMGLAPYGEPRYMKEMHELIDIKEDGSFSLNMEYFTFEHGLRMTGKKFEKLFGRERRKGEGTLEPFHKDVARSVQELTNEVMQKICAHAKELTGSNNLCLAGGVALNCVTNGKILQSNMFEDIFVQPASGDAGGALGVALAIWNRKFNTNQSTTNTKMEHVYYGREYSNEEIKKFLKEQGLPFDRLEDDELIEAIADLLPGENVIGWFQGRMEYGPRALGNRSIIADARNHENWKKVNLKIKFRESFRPFAPTVLEEKVSEWFDLDRPSPYMLLVADVKEDKREQVPAITHVDGSARIQTINREQNPRYYDLIKKFDEKTGCPVIINTSFNVRGEPIVMSPKDALNCFLHTQMDYLVLGNFLLSKKKILGTQTHANSAETGKEEYLAKFELD